MTTVTLKGQPVHLFGNFVNVGQKAPNFVLVNSDLSNVELYTLPATYKILNIVPSLDTGVCQQSTQTFNEKISHIPNVTVFTISADLPFAQKRFCSSNNIDKVIPLSMMRSNKFAHDYGVLIADGPLEGITTRAVIILSPDNHIIYTQLVQEITEEPNYEAAIKAVSV